MSKKAMDVVQRLKNDYLQFRRGIEQSGGTLRARVARTRQAIAAKEPSPVVVHAPVVRSEMEEDAKRRIANAERMRVSLFLSAEGVRDVCVVPDEKVENLGVFTGRWGSTKEMTRAFGRKFPEGAEILLVNPRFYAALGDEDRNAAINHELWHMYISRAFQAYNREIEQIDFPLIIQGAQFLKKTFFHHLGHFVLRIAAIEAGDQNFIFRECNLTLPMHLRVIEKGEHPLNWYYGFSYLAGLIFGYVLPFSFFGDRTAALTARSNRDLIERSIARRNRTKAEREQEKQLLTSAEDFSRKMLSPLSCYPGGRWDIATETLVNEALANWSSFKGV